MGIQNDNNRDQSSCSSICTICNKQINDLYFLIVGSRLHIHLNCLKCSICMNKLEMESKCFLTNGKFYCVEHWQHSSLKDILNKDNNNQQLQQQQQLSNCKNCKLQINPNDYVIRTSNDNLYHLSCFVCFKCNKLIEPGTKYGISNESVYCGQHYFLIDQQYQQQQQKSLDMNNNNQNEMTMMIRYDQNLTISSADSSSSSSSTCSSTSSSSSSPTLSSLSSGTINTKPIKLNTTNYNHQPLQNQNKLNSSTTTTTTTTAINPNHSHSHSSNKKKRIRTSFKHQQLRIMKAHFQINQNPDSKDLKELSERTGLQKRVLQVWFQNSRAKQRKSTGNNSIMSNCSGGFTSIINSKQSSFNNNNDIQMQMNSNDNNDTLDEYDECEEEEDEENLDDFDENFDLDDNSNNSKSMSLSTEEHIGTDKTPHLQLPISSQHHHLNHQQQSIIDFYHCF